MKKAVSMDNGLLAVVEDGKNGKATKRKLSKGQNEVTITFTPTREVRAMIDEACRLTGLDEQEMVRRCLMEADLEKCARELAAKKKTAKGGAR